MGPTVFTLPNLIDELFEIHNKEPRDYFSYSKLETSFKYFFEDGTSINAFSNQELFENEIEKKTADTKISFRKYLKDIATKYKITKNEDEFNWSKLIPNNDFPAVCKTSFVFHYKGVSAVGDLRNNEKWEETRRAI